MNARRLPALLGLLLLVAAFGYSLLKVARRSADAADPRTRVIRIAHWQLEAGIREAFDAMARRYEALHPGVRVEQIVVPERIFPTWVTTQLVGGTAPDLIALNSQFIGAERVARHFLPLTEAVESPNPYNVGTPLEGLPWRSTVQDGMEGSFHPELFEFYGVSPFAGTVRIYYNRALMARLVGHDGPPADFAAFEDLVRRVPELASTVGRPLVAMAGSRYNGPLTLDRAVSSQTQRLATGLNPLLAMPLDPRQFAVAHLAGDWDFTAPDLLGALELARFYARAMPPGFMQMERDDALFYFLQENALMIQSGSWDSGSVASQARFPVGVFNLPAPPPQHPIYRGAPGTVIAEGALRTTAGFGITQNSVEPELALDFLRFLVSHDGNRDFARLSGWLPVVLGAEPPPQMAAFMPVSEGFPPGPHLRAFPDSRRLFDNSLGALIGESGDVPAFIAALAPGFAAALRTDLARLQRGSVAALQRNEIALESTARLRASAVDPSTSRRLDAKHAALLEAQVEIESLLAWENFRLRPASLPSAPSPSASVATAAAATDTLAFALPLDGTDLERAAFEVWRPPGLTTPRLVLLCADYEDGRKVFDRADWRAFALETSALLIRHRLERATPPVRLAKDEPAAALVRAALREIAARWALPELATTTPLVFLGLSQAGWQAQALAHRLPDRTVAVIAWQAATGKRAPAEADQPAATRIPQLLVDAGLETFELRVPELHATARSRGARWTYLLRSRAVHHRVGDGDFERAWLRAVLSAPTPSPTPWHGTWKTLEITKNDRRPLAPAIGPGSGDSSATWLPDETTARAWLALMSAPDPS